MKIYDYSGRDTNGNLVKGKVFATSEHAAAKRLMNEDVIPVTIKKSAYIQRLLYIIRPLILRFAIVEKQDVIRFCSEISLLVKSGVPVRNAVANLAKSMKGKVLAQILNVIVIRLDAGQSLAQSFSNFPNVFPPLFIAFLKHADYASYTSSIFAQLGETLQARKEIKKQLFESS